METSIAFIRDVGVVIGWLNDLRLRFAHSTLAATHFYASIIEVNSVDVKETLCKPDFC